MKLLILVLGLMNVFGIYASTTCLDVSKVDDYFNAFNGSYKVTKRTCLQNDKICNLVDSIEIISKAGEFSHLLEISNGKILQDTLLNAYGEVTNTRYAVIYGTPTELAAWTEIIKNSSNTIIEENAAGIKQVMNTDEDGPLYIYNLGKSYKQLDPMTGRYKRQIRSYKLTLKH